MFAVYECAVNLMGDNIYMNNMDKHTLLTLAMGGAVISTFSDTDPKFTRGVHVTAGGHVRVCGYASNTIIQLDSEGKQEDFHTGY
ncbi:hypothetical protein DPMN_184434 [Dreissena polymorpha]|uniref:Uncharacterized protein n=1 Tax=Dreissena polymorpha TaxID=45954 RepID=A0A9D4I6F2_DREPO|nr:hypothetical protein DPMN_184434 [Dreissena polymorpha]